MAGDEHGLAAGEAYAAVVLGTLAAFPVAVSLKQLASAAASLGSALYEEQVCV